MATESASKLQVRVVTPERPIYEGDADRVVAPAHDGEVGILPRHARFLCRLGFGSLRVHDGDSVHRWFLDGGFAQVRDNHVTLLCERATEFAALDADAADRQAADARAAGRPDAAALEQRALVMRRVLGGRPPASH